MSQRYNIIDQKFPGLFIKDVTAKYSSIIPEIFPEIRDVKTTPVLFAAFNEHSNSVNYDVHGFAILSSPLATETPDYKFSIYVMEGSRGQGVGDALMQFILQHARYLRAPSLINLQPVIHLNQHRFLKKYNFELVRNTITFNFNLEKAFSFFETTIHLLKNKNKIPEGIELRPYMERTETSEISRLCMDEFGALTNGHLKSLGVYPAENSDYSFARSFWFNQKLLGAWGVGVEGEVAIFDPLLITKSKRNTWVFTFIIYTVLKNLLDAGVLKGQALVHSDNKKINAVMKRIDAVASDELSLYRISLDYDLEVA